MHDLDFLIELFAQQGLDIDWRKRVLRRYVLAPNKADWLFLAGMVVDSPGRGQLTLREAINQACNKQIDKRLGDNETPPTSDEIAMALTWVFLGG